jgi:hypothetical protein
MPSNSITVRFPGDIYDSSAVQTVRDAYAHLFHIGLDTSAPGTIVARFTQDEGDIDQALIDAFCNHALFETIRRFRTGEMVT